MAFGNDNASHHMQSSRNLFVAGLPPSLNDSALEALFEPYGSIASAKVMVDLHTAKSRCFGFVLFNDEPSAVAAQSSLNGKSIADGCTLVVNFSTAHSTNHLLEKSNAIYVRNIPKGTDVDLVQRHFSNFGEVTNVEMLPDTAAGATGKFIVAKVTFTKTEVAVEAEKKTQCAPNVFAEVMGGDVSLKAPPLLAKLAENHNDRIRRIAQARGKTAAQPPQAVAASHVHTQPHQQAPVPYMFVPHPSYAAMPGQPWMQAPPMMMHQHQQPMWQAQPVMLNEWGYPAQPGLLPTPVMLPPHHHHHQQAYTMIPIASSGHLMSTPAPGGMFPMPTNFAAPPYVVVPAQPHAALAPSADMSVPPS